MLSFEQCFSFRFSPFFFAVGGHGFVFCVFVFGWRHAFRVVKQLLFAHSIPGHHRPMGRPHLTWMDTAMHDMGSLGRTLQIDLPRDWANLALYRDVWRGVVSRC